jgi:hypothetical protein
MTYEEPKFVIQLQAVQGSTLDLNICPLYAPDGTALTGGLVKAGGSTLVVAGNAVGQWAGEGLAVTHAFVPHFDLPGGSFVSSGVIGVSGSVSSIDRLGSGTFRLANEAWHLVGSNLNTGSTTASTGPLTITENVLGYPMQVSAGSIITAADGTTQTLAAGESLVVVGPSKITTPAGQVITVIDGVYVNLLGHPAATTGDTSTGDTSTGNTTTGDTATSDTTTTDTTTGDSPTTTVAPDPTPTTTPPTEPA